MKCMDEATDVEFQIIGLIRNPMATIYSQFQQWRSPPAKLEQQWRVAYQNLLRLKERLDDRVILLQYKEMVTSTDWLYPVAKFCELNFADVDKQHMHARSLEKWKQDRWFGHQLTDETRDLARQFGYDDAELSHTSYATWPIVWRAQRLSYRLSRPLLSTAYRLSARLRGIDVSE